MEGGKALAREGGQEDQQQRLERAEALWRSPLVEELLPKAAAKPPPTEAWELSIETVNGTAWASIKKHLRVTTAEVLLVQEHHLGPEACVEASSWAKKRRWKTMWSPANPGGKDHSSSWIGGVAIFVRDHLALSSCRLQNRPFPGEVDDRQWPGQFNAGQIAGGSSGHARWESAPSVQRLRLLQPRAW